MRKIKEENWVSSGIQSLQINLCVSLSNCLFLTRPKVMKTSKVITSMRASRLAEMGRKQRLMREGPPLLRWLTIIPRQRGKRIDGGSHD
jgi:hypothetical protein